MVHDFIHNLFYLLMDMSLISPNTQTQDVALIGVVRMKKKFIIFRLQLKRMDGFEYIHKLDE